MEGDGSWKRIGAKSGGRSTDSRQSNCEWVGQGFECNSRRHRRAGESGSAWPVAESVADGDKQVEEDKGKVTEDSGKEEFVECSEDYAMDELDRLRLLLDTTAD
ncbi:uncharacterized protein LOC126599181 [Malus sylvestris]|uniref:uncharacterized protein LOC126599181 n=1 Tax=Malus sylvestris TaxID=3752 RepID=UPI0021AD2056|nr:uncharacterized protein LOC126599181 [Malus sylvestris]